MFFNLFALCCCRFDVINLRLAARLHGETEAAQGAQTKQQKRMFPESSLALRPPRSATSGRMSWALCRITDVRHYFHFRIEFPCSSFSLSVIPVDYKLGPILILLDISFICDNSTKFTELMVERSESHISCKKKLNGVRKTSTLLLRYIKLSLLNQMEAGKQKYGISNLTKFHFQSFSFVFRSVSMKLTWVIAGTFPCIYYINLVWKVFQSHHLSQPTRCCHHAMMGLVTKALCAAVSSVSSPTSHLHPLHFTPRPGKKRVGVWGLGIRGSGLKLWQATIWRRTPEGLSDELWFLTRGC